MAELRIPKYRTPVELLLVDGTTRNVLVFLAEFAARRSGPERVSDLLDGEAEFIPAIDVSTDAVCFLNRTLVTVARVAAAVDGDDEAHRTVRTEHEVEITLVGDAKLRGRVTYVLPPGRSRLLDFLNAEPRFIKLIEQDGVAFVNKQHISLIEAVNPDR